MKKGSKQLQKDERGLVSIIITLIIMIVLSLIVIGFAQLSRREQREALDRELSLQAQYAAESGINDAKKYVKTQLTTAPDTTVLIEDCNSAVFTNKVIDPTAQISYTCALVNSAPDTLIYDNIDVDKSRIIKIDPKKRDGTDAKLNTLDLYWKRKGVDTLTMPGSSAPDFPKTTSWTADAPGVMRIDLISTEGGFGRSSLATNTFTVFGYPTGGGGSVAFATGLGAQGQVASADCNAANNTPEKPFFCKLSINVSAAAHTVYYLRVKSIYAQSQLGIRATYIDGASTVSARLHGEQAHLDVTGKANDVLKRIKTGYPVADDTDPAPPAEAAAQSAGAICKYFSVYPPSGFNDTGCSWTAGVNSRPNN